MKTANWCDTQPLCTGNMGLERIDMPQIPEERLSEFVHWARARGVVVTATTLRVRDMQPTQREIKAEKVDTMIAGGVDSLINSHPLLVSADNYILDGHHRWTALLATAPDTALAVLQVGLPIQETLNLAHAFPGSKRESSLRTKVIRLASASRACARKSFAWQARTRPYDLCFSLCSLCDQPRCCLYTRCR